MTVAAALTIIGTALGVLGLVLIPSSVRVSRTSPVGVLRRLRQAPGGYVVRVGRSSAAWNPGRRPLDRGGGVGPGTAIYRLERAPDGAEIVHLDWTPGDTPPRHTQGPVTDRLSRLADGRRLGNLLLSPLLIIGVQCGLAAIGVIVGLAVTAGHDQQSQVVAVFVGCGCGLFLPVFAALAASVGLAVWRTVR